jgi:Protein of unknown function (DUF3039)
MERSPRRTGRDPTFPLAILDLAPMNMGGDTGNVNLCGFRFPLVRDPQRFPVCPKCRELAGMLGIGG